MHKENNYLPKSKKHKIFQYFFLGGRNPFFLNTILITDEGEELNIRLFFTNDGNPIKAEIHHMGKISFKEGYRGVRVGEGGGILSN